MPYALSNLENGQPPGYRWVKDAAEILDHELFTDAKPQPDAVWDTAAAALRLKTDTEKLGEAQAKKIDEFAARTIEELEPHFTGSHGRDETLHILAGHVAQICQALGIAVDPRLAAVVATGQKAYQKKAQVEGVSLTDATGNPRSVETAIAEVEGIQW